MYVSCPLDKDLEVLLSTDQAHYLLIVLRKTSGDQILLFNGRDGEWLAEIKKKNKKECLALCKKQVKVQNFLPSVSLAFSPLKKHRQDFLIEKATELGVTHLIPLEMGHTNLLSFNHEKVRLQCREASEQCERLSVPEVEKLTPFGGWLKLWPIEKPLYVALERLDTPVSFMDVLNHPKDVAFLVGPEGGFSEDEVMLLSQQPFVRFFSLGSLILRAETAAVVCVGLYQQLKKS